MEYFHHFYRKNNSHKLNYFMQCLYNPTITILMPSIPTLDVVILGKYNYEI
jgi:hypothetical protein